MSAQSFTACLLAGGKSSRMGRDKAGVEFGGIPLWQHQVEILRQTGADEILISGRDDACYAGSGFPIIGDEIKGNGPLSGVHALLGVAAHPMVLMLAVDMPAMMGGYLRGLVARAFEEGYGMVPVRDGFYEGLAAVYPRASREIAAGLLEGDDYSMQGYVAGCVGRGLVVPVEINEDEMRLFQNMNTAGISIS
ncbi:MAG: molybdenum cofactor guanylyltransferase [Chthoniobacteraceae bacterium]